MHQHKDATAGHVRALIGWEAVVAPGSKCVRAGFQVPSAGSGNQAELSEMRLQYLQP